MPFDTATGTFLVPGPAGASAYEAWRGLGNAGTVEDFLATLVGAQGPASTEPGPEGRPGRDGAGSVTTRIASAPIPPWTAVVADGVSNCLPADPFNEAHRGRVFGITAYGGGVGSSVEIQNTGDLTGPANAFEAQSVQFIGQGGVLAPSAPVGAMWRQPVATVVSNGHVVVQLGEASLIYDALDAMLGEGGFSAPCPLDRGASLSETGYVTSAANARALIAALAGTVPADLPPRRGQFLRALEAALPGSIATLFNAVPTDLADPINMAWSHTIGVVPACRLAQFAKTTLGLTDAQIAAAIAAARSIQE